MTVPDASAIAIRPARPEDCGELLRLMHGIVHFERGTDFRLTEEELLHRGFGAHPEFGAFVADRGNGQLVGMVVHYEIPFMHTLRPLLMMKWLYVDPALRGQGVGRRLMARMARHAKETGHTKFFWFVLQDNAPAQAFYRGVDATPDPEWGRWMLGGPAIGALAAEA